MQDPPEPGAGLFGVCPREDTIRIIGVPWEPTASYGRGASRTPQALVPASHQLDFYDGFLAGEFGETVGMADINEDWLALNERCIKLAKPIIAAGGAGNHQLAQAQAEVNEASQRINSELYELAGMLLNQGKLVGVLGGDHSSPLGLMKACLEFFPGTAVLHIDAHHDLRVAYEGFTYSHASIMYNLLNEVEQLTALTSVGIRDFCSEEHQLAEEHPKVVSFYDRDLKRALFQGRSWQSCCAPILETLPESVYISFDIDGCSPEFCPNTGTPVPGGLSYDQAVYLLESVVESGRRVVGFDLCEVAPDPHHPDREWDLNVGARLLHKLCVLVGMSQVRE